jgi:hypothetical protein
MSVLDFLQLHYTDEHPEDNDGQDDAGLPFKSVEGINHLDQPWVYSPLFISLPCPELESCFTVCFKQGRPCGEVYGIFRPPRYA